MKELLDELLEDFELSWNISEISELFSMVLFKKKLQFDLLEIAYNVRRRINEPRKKCLE